MASLTGSWPFPLQPLPESLALDVGHHVVDQAVGLVGIVERENVRVMKPGRGLDLVKEASGSHASRDVRPEHLDRDLAVVLEIVGEEDLRHPALTQLALDPVAGGDRSTEALDQFRHNRRPAREMRPQRKAMELAKI